MSGSSRAPVLAAGALVWRLVDEEPLVLLVERTQHRDCSLPKGKLDPGETLPECAVREIEEETGLRITLGAPLPHSEYRLPDGRDKVVYYWQAKVDDEAVAASRFTPNDEILALEWLPLEAAKQRCTYPHDAEIIECFKQRLAAGHAETFPIIALRHGKAVNPFNWDGPDASRTLTSKGEKQARLVAPGIAAFGPRKVFTSDAVRCVQTAEPLAQLLGVTPKATGGISQASRGDLRAEVERRIRKAVRKCRGTVLCSHAPIIPEIVSAVVHAVDAAETDRTHRASMLHTAEFTVLHVAAGTPALVGLETHGPREV